MQTPHLGLIALTASLGVVAGLVGPPGVSWMPAAAAQEARHDSRSDRLGQAVPPDLLQRLEDISQTGLSQRPRFERTPLKAIDASADAAGAKAGDGDARTGAADSNAGAADSNAGARGRPLVLYIGADFCPYCAVLRWPLAITLMRFGDLSGLRYTRSSARDVFPSTATFSFIEGKLDSGLIELQAVELQDREGKPLARPTDAQRDLFLKLNPGGSIPFLYLGGKYVEVGSPFSPQPMQGLDWEQIVEQLEQGGNAVWQDVIGDANVLTAALCTLTNRQPNEVCTASGIQAAAQRLPH